MTSLVFCGGYWVCLNYTFSGNHAFLVIESSLINVAIRWTDQKQQSNYVSDIDECAKNTHNCDTYAYCNNTKGGYNCSCHPGYYGDGKNCKPGESAVFLSILKMFGRLWQQTAQLNPANPTNAMYVYHPIIWASTYSFHLQPRFRLQKRKFKTRCNSPEQIKCLVLYYFSRRRYFLLLFRAVWNLT